LVFVSGYCCSRFRATLFIPGAIAAAFTSGFRRPITLNHPFARSNRSLSVKSSGTQIFARPINVK
jgi:hypothetical protein